MSETIRILLVEDHAVVRAGLRVLLPTEPGLEVVGEAADGLEAVEQAGALQPDIVLLDLVMPRQDGLAAIPQIKQVSPDSRIIVLTSFAEDEKVFAAIKAGAVGYLLKEASPQELLQAIRAVYQGEVSLSPFIAQKLMRELNRPPATQSPAEAALTGREEEVLGLVAQGMLNDEIATQLNISERTVRTHISHILEKLHLVNRTQAALYALRSGLARLE
jgi:NarL family two-component system response regulator LiaR